MLHELKIESHYLDSVICGDKTFEIRENDRGFQKGDIVILREYGSKAVEQTREVKAVITYVTNYMQHENYVVFGIKIAEQFGVQNG